MKIGTYRMMRVMEAVQFRVAEANSRLPVDLPPGIDRISNSGKREDGTIGPLPYTYWVHTNDGDSYRLNDGDWVAWDPLNLWLGFSYYTDEQFRAAFTEV